MRKLALLSSLFLIAMTVCFFNSCKKETSNDFSDIATINKVKAWLNNKKTTKEPNNNTKIDSLKENLDFAKLRFEKLNNKEQFIAIPIIRNFISRNNQDKNPINTLLLVLNDSGIVRGTIIQYIPQNRNGSNIIPTNTFTKIYNNKEIECNGQFSVLTITDEFEYELSYKNGKLNSYSLMQNKTSSSNSGRVQQCWETYLVTYYSDGSETWQYLYTWCDGPCNETRNINGRQFRVNCGGGGGSGTGETCCIPLDQNIQLTTDHTVSDEEYICNTESVDPVSGNPIKSCTSKWTYSTNQLLFYTWKFQSIELSNQEKISGVWKIKENGVSHQGQTQTGTIPPCTTFTSTISSAVPAIDGSRLSARMNLIVTEQFNVTCCPWCSPSYSNFNASNFWLAQ